MHRLYQRHVDPSKKTRFYPAIAAGAVDLPPFTMDSPSIGIGKPKDYAEWVARAKEYLREFRQDPDQLDYVAARFGYRTNRITLLRLPQPDRELSVADTLSHEVLHALLDQLGESYAARTIDMVCKPVGHPLRRGGV